MSPKRLPHTETLEEALRQRDALLSRVTAELAALNEAGQALSRLADPADLLERMYAALGTVLNNRNLYIALADASRQQLTFPIYTIDGTRRTPAARPFGNGITEYIIQTGKPLWIPHSVTPTLKRLGIAGAGREAKSFLGVPMTAGERIVGVIAVQDYNREDVYTEEHRDLLATFAAQAAVALENARLFQDVKRRATRQADLAALIAAAASGTPMPDLLSTTLTRTIAALGAWAGAAWVGGLEVSANLPAGAASEMAAAALQADFTAEERTLVVNDVTTAADQQAVALRALAEKYGVRAAIVAHIWAGARHIGALAVFRDVPAGWTAEDVQWLESVTRELAGAAQRQRGQDRILAQLKTLSSLYAVARKLSQTLDLDPLVADVVRTTVSDFDADAVFVGRLRADGGVRILGHYGANPDMQAAVAGGWEESAIGDASPNRGLRSGLPVIETDLQATTTMSPQRAQVLLRAGVRAAATFPLIARGRTFGVLGVGSDSARFFTTRRVDLFQAYAHLVAAALENARLFAEATERFTHLQALREIDTAITGSADARVAMGVLLEKVTTSLRVDAADILALNPTTQTLDFLAGRGFRSSALQHTRLRIGQGYAGRAVSDHTMVSITDLRQSPGELVRAPDLVHEDFVAYHAVPLIVKGQVNGVLEIFHRSLLHTDSDWMDFLMTVAGQAAVALESAMLFERLQRANADLSLAYDTTLEGWVHALDLRNKEPTGHAQRLTELTVRLARAMGMAPEQIVHVRRGALLHDIGMMGIPESILLKPGPLSEEELATVRRHPVYARDLLAPITFLRPALFIPYCHHEHWDGSGYPQGLKGNEIPLEARIFAVIDVWDALTSDRPYRPAWTPEQARDHIREMAGKQFDPQVVSAFFGLSDFIAVA
jgi:HD-GYP domain-containing protein (c-di-GMP phosphodiesterase class II)